MFYTVKRDRLFHFIAALILQIACFAGPKSFAATHEAQPVSLPTYFKAHWRNLAATAPFVSVSCEWNGQELRYEAVRASSDKDKKNEARSIRPRAAAWKEFWKSLDELNVQHWGANYPARPSPGDAGDWSLAIDWSGKHVRSRGTNSYPHMVDITKPADTPVMVYRLWHAIDRLIGRPVEVEGRYLAGFEISRFHPVTKSYAGQMWWLISNKDLNDRYSKLRPKERGIERLAGPEVSVRVRGTLVGPGRYGHLEQYDHEFIVEELLELKALP